MKKLLLFLLFPLPLLPQAASINGGTLLQPIDGFGVAQAFSGPTSTTPINAEFSPTGIGLKYIRTQIYPDQADCAAKEGNPCASAAQGGTISLNDLAVVQAAVSNGAILWGSMWSPPASMKSNGSFQGTGNMIGNPTNYAALATIQASFVTLLTGTYGIPVYAISVQNEPNVTVSYQSCLWTATQLHDYIPYLKTALTNAGYPNVKIMISEPAGWAQGPTYNSTSMNDATVAGDIGILANHQYDYTYAAQSYSNVTTQHLWETEVSNGNPYDGSMTDGLTWAQLIHNSLVTAQMNAWHYWLATDAAGRGDNESLTNSSYSIAKRAYVMGQWARCATGKTEIAATANPQSGVYVTAFLNSSSGSFCIVALNNNSGTVSQTFNLSGGLSASSMSTLFTDPSNNMASGSSISVSGSSFAASLTGSSVSTFFSNPGTTNYNITITASNGTLSGGTNCVAGTNSYASGTSISCLPPTPNAGYAFAGWSGTGSFSSASGTGTVSGTLTSNSTLTATITPSTAPWSGLLAASRAINWGSAGAGTIPSRTTICTTLGTASQAPTFAQSVTSAQIVAAIAACPANQVVYLNAGTYSLSTSIMGPGNGGAWPNNVTLRGAGANQTILKFSAFTNNCLGYGPTGVCMYNGSSGVAQYADNVLIVTGGVGPGATSITLGSAPGTNICSVSSPCPGNISNLHQGSLMEINQQDDCNDTGDWFESGYGPNFGNNCQLVTWGGTSNAWPPNWPSGTTNLGRSLTQVVRVTNISGSTITFSPALYGGKWNQSKSPLAIYSNAAPLVGASIENLKIDTSLLGDEQAMLGTVWNYGCWYTNVAFVNPTTTSTSLATRKHALLASGLNNTFANNYMYGSASGSDAYGVDQVQGETNDLIQNNIAHHMASAFMTETAVGSVFGYNFDADNYYFNGNGAQWQQAELYHHDAGDMFNLYEGHEGIEAINDDIHGTSFGLTYFRNYLSGHDKATMCPGGGNGCGTSAAGKIQNTAAYDDFAFARYANFAFNVIGDGTYANTYNNVGTQGTPNSCPGYAWTVLYTLDFSNSNQQPFSPNCTGTSYTIDNDSLVATSLMRWGNYDTVTSTVRTVTGENGSSAPTYPALVSPSTSYSSFPSLYLPGKPVWWQFINGNASTPFPANGPEVTGGNIANVGGHANHNPAGNCYLNVLMGKQDGSSGPLNYDASLCYPTTAPPQAATPVPSPAPGSYAGPLNVTFTDSTPASSMFCTTDGSPPTPASAAYPSGGFTLSATGTYQCVATASGFTTSLVGGGAYTISTSTLAAPTFSPNTTPNYYLTLPSVTITCPASATCGYTTDGSTPTATGGTITHGTVYTTPVTPVSGTPFQAIASRSGFNNSVVTSATYIQTNIVPDGDGLFNGGSSSVTTVNVTISPTPSAGDGITCEGVWGNNTSTATISDPTGACSTALPSFYNGATFSTSQAWKCNNVPGGSAAISMTLSASTPYVGFACQAWKPKVIGTFTLDSAVTTIASGNGTAASTSSATPANFGEVVIPYLMTLQRNATPGAGFYAIDALPNGPQLFPEYQIQTTATASNAPFTIASSDNWTAQQMGLYFATANFTLSTAIAGTGSGTVTGCAGTYSSGASYSCSINATVPATIASVTGCGGTLTSTTYAGTMPGSNCTVTATFTAPTAATPVPSPATGPYSGAQVVSFTDSTPGANLYCTLDGSTPTPGGQPYNGPYTVSATTTIKCVAAAAGYISSAVGGGTYTITTAPQPPVKITGTMKLSGGASLQ